MTYCQLYSERHYQVHYCTNNPCLFVTTILTTKQNCNNLPIIQVNNKANKTAFYHVEMAGYSTAPTPVHNKTYHLQMPTNNPNNQDIRSNINGKNNRTNNIMRIYSPHKYKMHHQAAYKPSRPLSQLQPTSRSYTNVLIYLIFKNTNNRNRLRNKLNQELPNN